MTESQNPLLILYPVSNISSFLSRADAEPWAEIQVIQPDNAELGASTSDACIGEEVGSQIGQEVKYCSYYYSVL